MQWRPATDFKILWDMAFTSENYYLNDILFAKNSFYL